MSVWFVPSAYFFVWTILLHFLPGIIGGDDCERTSARVAAHGALEECAAALERLLELRCDRYELMIISFVCNFFIHK